MPGVALLGHVAALFPLGVSLSAFLTKRAAPHLAPLSRAHSGYGILFAKMGVSAQEPRDCSGLVGQESIFSMPLGHEAGARQSEKMFDLFMALESAREKEALSCSRFSVQVGTVFLLKGGSHRLEKRFLFFIEEA